MMSGQTTSHEKFERMAAEFEMKEAAYLLNYGYQGMVSIIDSLVDRHDVIVYDSESHACIMDGLRLHFGKRFVFPHNDIASCEKQLQRAEKLTEGSGGGILVITEGVFGMAGDLGKLDKIAELKRNTISGSLWMMLMDSVLWVPTEEEQANILEFRIRLMCILQHLQNRWQELVVLSPVPGK